MMHKNTISMAMQSLEREFEGYPSIILCGTLAKYSPEGIKLSMIKPFHFDPFRGLAGCEPPTQEG